MCNRSSRSIPVGARFDLQFGNRALNQTSIHTALKEFFQPLRSNDTRADFFAVYRKESEEFDRDYAGKYDEDLNTSLIFVSRETSDFEDCALNGGHLYRLVCFRRSAQRSSSTSNPISNPIRAR